MHKLTPLALALAAGPLAFAEYASAGEVVVDGIRLGLTPGRTRVVFDLSAAANYHLQDDPAARQVTVTLDDAGSAFDPSRVALEGSGINAISTSPGEDGAITYVFSLDTERNPSLFALAPHLNSGHRLVLDLYAGGNAAEGADTQDDDSAATAQGATRDVAGTAPATAAATGAAATRTRVPRSAYFADEGDEDDGPYGEDDFSDGDFPDSDFADEGSGYDYDYGEEGSGSQLSGYISMEPRLFFDDAAYSGQDDQNLSFAAEMEYYLDWDDGAQRLAFRPFGRYDLQDDERSHADIRELYWRMERDNFLVKAGIDVVFWGVAESRHLVDIINQTDLVENIDGEDKLGQPMLNFDYMSDNWGTLQFYVLPYFRERTFPGEEGRLRPDPAIDEDDAEYESGDEEEHIDFAVRWSHYIGDWDIGIAHFSGTSRDPLLLPGTSGGEFAIIPYYPQIEQTSLDTQATLGAWLWKLEAIYNDNDVDSYYAWVGGFEYTLYGVRGSDADMGLLLEYNYDDRGEDSTSALQEDVYVGVRWSGNDTNSTELLAALVYDTDNESTFGNIEASRRLGEHWTLGMEVRIFTNVDDNDLLYFIEDDDYAEIQITRHF